MCVPKRFAIEQQQTAGEVRHAWRAIGDVRTAGMSYAWRSRSVFASRGWAHALIVATATGCGRGGMRAQDDGNGDAAGKGAGVRARANLLWAGRRGDGGRVTGRT